MGKLSPRWISRKLEVRIFDTHLSTSSGQFNWADVTHCVTPPPHPSPTREGSGWLLECPAPAPLCLGWVALCGFELIKHCILNPSRNVGYSSLLSEGVIARLPHHENIPDPLPSPNVLRAHCSTTMHAVFPCMSCDLKCCGVWVAGCFGVVKIWHDCFCLTFGPFTVASPFPLKNKQVHENSWVI